MFHYQLYEFGALYGMLYTFVHRGDGIGMHDHEEAQKHNLMVVAGSIEVYGPGKAWSATLQAGEVMALGPAEHPHEFVALEDGTEVLGMFIHGRPAGEALPEDEKRGTIRNRPVTVPLD